MRMMCTALLIRRGPGGGLCGAGCAERTGEQ